MPDQSIKLKHFEDIPNLYYVFEKAQTYKADLCLQRFSRIVKTIILISVHTTNQIIHRCKLVMRRISGSHSF